jgi:phage nucleotide-binding protein
MNVKKLKKSKPVVKPKSDDIGSRIRPVADIPDFSSTLLYGEGGTGKTALSGTFPKPMLVIDIAERGTKTLKKTPGIDVLRVSSWEEIEEIYWWLYDGKGKGKYKTVSLDQISQMQDIAINKVRTDKNMKKNDKTSYKFWGEVSGLMKEWLGNFRNLQELGVYVIFVAHQRTFDGEGEEGDNQIDPSVGARLMPSVSSFLNGAVSNIGNTFIRERYIGKGKDRKRKVDYCLRVGPHAVYRSKIRRPPDAGPLPEFIVSPTFEKLEKVSRGESLESTKTTVKRKK